MRGSCSPTLNIFNISQVLRFNVRLCDFLTVLVIFFSEAILTHSCTVSRCSLYSFNFLLVTPASSCYSALVRLVVANKFLKKNFIWADERLCRGGHWAGDVLSWHLKECHLSWAGIDLITKTIASPNQAFSNNFSKIVFTSIALAWWYWWDGGILHISWIAVQNRFTIANPLIGTGLPSNLILVKVEESDRA